MPTINNKILEQRQGKARNFYRGGKPLLRVSKKKKIADDMSHTKDVLDFFVESSWFQDQATRQGQNFRDLYTFYEAYNARIPESEFHFVTNPLNTKKEDYKAFPARIRSYSIIRPNIDLLVGEYEKRPKNFQVVVKNGDSINYLQDEINRQVKLALEQQFVNAMNKMGVQTGMDSAQVEPPVKIKARMEESWQDSRAIMGQAMEEKIREECNIEEKENEMFLDWLVAGEMYSYKNLLMGDVVYERVSPLDIDYDKSPGVKFVEDGTWAVRRMYMTPSDVAAKFWDQITPDDIDNMEEQDSTLPFTATYFNTLFGNTYRSDEDMRRSKIPVYHGTWKYYKQIGFVYYNDEFGEEQSFEIAEGYKAGPGERVEWFWVPEWWEGYRADLPVKQDGNVDVSGLYFNMGPVPVQRNMMNNQGFCKGPYNGMRFSDTHSRNVSLVELGMPYEIMYIILHYRLELTIAKNKGKIALIDQNVLPRTGGMTEDTAFYYAESMGFLPINRMQDGVDRTYNQYQVLDMDLFAHINNMIEVIEYIKSEWDRLVGITSQRRGEIKASETATGVNAARYQSSVISERVFTKAEEFFRRERQGIMDLTKFVNLDNYKSIFFSDDTRRQLVGIVPEDYMESEYGIYVSSSPRDMDDLFTLKQAIPNMAPNMDPELLLDTIQSRNISKLKRVLHEKKVSEIELQNNAQKSQAQREAAIKEIEKEFMETEKQFDKILMDAEYDRKEDLEHIKGQYSLADTNEAGDSLDPMAVQDSLLNIEKAREDALQGREKLKIEKDKVKADREKADKDLEGKKYVADKGLEVAKENKNQFDKKKSS